MQRGLKLGSEPVFRSLVPRRVLGFLSFTDPFRASCLFGEVRVQDERHGFRKNLGVLRFVNEEGLTHQFLFVLIKKRTILLS